MHTSLRSFEDFVRCIDAFLLHKPPAKAWHGRRSASVARRCAACDHLITAALVHDFAACLGARGTVANVALLSADLLGGVFPAPVLAPLRLIDAPPPQGAVAPPQLLAQSRRLRRFIEGEKAEPEGPLLSWTALRAIARRASLDG